MLMGQFHFSIGGVRLHSEKGGSFDPGGKTMAPANSTDGYVGPEVEEHKNSSAKFSLILTDAITLDFVRTNLVDTTMTIECDSGETWVMPGATHTGKLEVKNGRCDVEVFGATAERV